MVVVDSSAIVQACLSDADLDAIERLDPIAPPLLWSEVTSVLHELQWRRQVSADLTARARTRFASMAIRRRSPSRLQVEAWAIATRLGWAKTYDAEYVALARLSDCALLTIDARLARAATAIVTVEAPPQR